MTLIISLISIFLDGLISLYIGYNVNNLSIFLPNFTLISIIIGYYTFKNKKLYIPYFIIISIIYDILYTDIFMYTTLIYYIIYLVMKKFSKEINVLEILGYVMIYNILNYLLYGLLYDYINLIYLIKICYSSLILNTLYIFILDLFLGRSYFKMKKGLNFN